MLAYFQGRVKVRNAHTERWRDAFPARRQGEIDARYGEILDAPRGRRRPLRRPAAPRP